MMKYFLRLINHGSVCIQDFFTLPFSCSPKFQRVLIFLFESVHWGICNVCGIEAFFRLSALQRWYPSPLAASNVSHLKNATFQPIDCYQGTFVMALHYLADKWRLCLAFYFLFCTIFFLEKLPCPSSPLKLYKNIDLEGLPLLILPWRSPLSPSIMSLVPKANESHILPT